MTVLIVGIVLSESGCVSSRRMTGRIETKRIWSDVRDSVVSSVVDAVHDTIREVTMVTVQQNAAGDTVKVVQITDRTRASDRSRADRVTHRSEVRVDTVYVEKRDSSFVKNTNGTNRASPVAQTLKWVFWIIIALIALVIVIKVSRMFRI